MQTPAFWYAPEPTWLAQALRPLAWLYGHAATLHGTLRARRPYYAAVPVISVGNLTVGGSGKTPLVEALARHFARLGHQVAVVSRGYGGRETRWPLQVDIHRHDARQVGDEPLMLARTLADEAVAVWVGRNRPATVRRAEEAGATLIILDDAFQRRDIGRNADILVIDGPRGFGNGLPLPAGPLREPLAARARAHFAVVIDESAARPNAWYGLPAYRLNLHPDATALAALKGQKMVAFAGIGDPAKFFALLASHNLDVVEQFPFPDHHRYTARDLANLHRAARHHQARLVTTAKDAAKLPPAFAAVLPVSAGGPDWPAILADLAPRLS
jgi:tetraacyldisaccharide 4'-kinase